jgi:hypothetical protein
LRRTPSILWDQLLPPDLPGYSGADVSKLGLIPFNVLEIRVIQDGISGRFGHHDLLQRIYFA